MRVRKAGRSGDAHSNSADVTSWVECSGANTENDKRKRWSVTVDRRVINPSASEVTTLWRYTNLFIIIIIIIISNEDAADRRRCHRSTRPGLTGQHEPSRARTVGRQRNPTAAVKSFCYYSCFLLRAIKLIFPQCFLAHPPR